MNYIIELLLFALVSTVMNVKDTGCAKIDERKSVIYEIENPQSHCKKIYTPYNAVTDKSSNAYRLIQYQFTDEETGIRYVIDQFGDKRYCVALGGYWADMEIGRLFDLYMENGTIVKCITCDAKQWQHTQKGEGKYGSIANDLIEFYVDTSWRQPVDYYYGANGQKIWLMYSAGDVSTVSKYLSGAIKYIEVYEVYLEGFDNE